MLLSLLAYYILSWVIFYKFTFVFNFFFLQLMVIFVYNPFLNWGLWAVSIKQVSLLKMLQQTQDSSVKKKTQNCIVFFCINSSFNIFKTEGWVSLMFFFTMAKRNNNIKEKKKILWQFFLNWKDNFL